MYRRRWAIGAALVLAGLAVASVSAVHAQGQTKVVTSAISGQVLPLRLATAGQAVKQGDPLVFVRTSTGGAVPAAAAPFDGHVTQVFVSAGSFVNIGDPVAAVEPQ